MAGCPAYFKQLNKPIIETLKSFAQHVCTGYYGQRRTVKMGTVQLMLSAIRTTLILEGCTAQNLLKDVDGKSFILSLCYLLQSYSNRDSATKKELTAPLELILSIKALLHHKSVKFRRVSQLITLAFFFLLCVGKYTKPRRVTRTVQFRSKDILF